MRLRPLYQALAQGCLSLLLLAPALAGKSVSVPEAAPDRGGPVEFWPVAVTEGEVPAGPQPKVIYGTDDRLDWYQVNDSQHLAWAKSTVVLVAPGDIERQGDQYILNNAPWYTYRAMCNNEPFRDQPSPGFCSGFLVGQDIIATAGHCVDNQTEAQETYFVFGFAMESPTQARVQLPLENVYRGSEVLGRELVPGGADYAIIRLDRPVTAPGAFPLPIRREGAVSNGTLVGVIGHPAGLPSKISFGASTRVRDSSPGSYFITNLDTFGGNSGSAVFNAATGLVEGILVRGEQDYIFTSPQNCFVSNRISDSSGSGEDVTKASAFASLVPPLEPTVTQLFPDGPLERGAVRGLTVQVQNPTRDALTNVSVLISVISGPATLSTSTLAIGTLEAGASAGGSLPLQVSATAECGEPIQLEARITWNGGEATPRTFSFLVDYGDTRSLLYAGFDDGMLPQGWSVVDGGGAGLPGFPQPTWTTSNPGLRTEMPGPFIAVDSDASSDGANHPVMDEQLITRAIDCSAWERVLLSFDHAFRSYEVSTGTVLARSSRTGGKWEEVIVFTDASSGRRTLDISGHAAGASNVQVNFQFEDHGRWEWYWLLDNVEIHGQSCEKIEKPSGVDGFFLY